MKALFFDLDINVKRRSLRLIKKDEFPLMLECHIEITKCPLDFLCSGRIWVLFTFTVCLKFLSSDCV